MSPGGRYLRAYESATEARTYIGRFIRSYNSDRPHSSLGGCTPDEVYFNLPRKKAA
jgi:putative transposase